MIDTMTDRVAAVCAAAAAHGEVPPGRRGGLLGELADALDADGAELVRLAHAETALAETVLTGELARTTGQMRMFADVAAGRDLLDIVVEPGDPSAVPPRPELRRMNTPIGPVAVYAASNFPFALSVAGGDTAAALAAGCPVVVKAHPGHPRLSERTADLLREVAPDGAFALVSGFDAGIALVTDPHIAAVAFTGSARAGRALFDLARSRPDPIPFYGELGSVNPVFVTPKTAAARGTDLVAGFTTSYTRSAGQLCTAPGLLFLPAGHGLDQELARAAEEVAPHRMLTPTIREAYGSAVATLAARPEVRTILGGPPEADDAPAPMLCAVAARDLSEELWEEVFGPVSLVVEYDSAEELLAAAEAMPGSLTATVHGDPDDDLAAALLDRVRGRAGRVVWNGWPTGVAVGVATHHGGPWPATTAPLHTSMGTAAVRRFLVPVAYQDVPEHLLPEPLRNPRVGMGELPAIGGENALS